MALHGGDVTIESTPGEGTVVTCRIPDQPDRAPEKAA